MTTADIDRQAHRQLEAGETGTTPADAGAQAASEAVYPIDPDTLLIDYKTASAIGDTCARDYQSAEPYNHICIDNFLPAEILQRVRQDIAILDAAASEGSFARAQENLKTQWIPERLPKYSRDLFYSFNSRPFIQFLEHMTGIRGLIPDPYFGGAGIHSTANGGHLDIHADFNHHHHLNVERRLNVLIYLNDDWQEEWGGCFEMWDKQMTRQIKKLAPVFNRMVTFSTASDTFHGNPEPVNHPDGKPRQSIALYYYTATWHSGRKSHSTLFAPRPGTADQVDRQARRHAILKEILPPFIYHRIIGRLARLGF